MATVPFSLQAKALSRCTSRGNDETLLNKSRLSSTLWSNQESLGVSRSDLDAGRGSKHSTQHAPARTPRAATAAVKRNPKRLKYAGSASHMWEKLVVEVNPLDDDNSQKLKQVADMIVEGAVGIIPTDTVYAIVCDLQNRDAVDRMYRIKDMDPKKPLSILCRSFQDIDTYTLGFPRGNGHGQTNIFRAARQCLPGPYTFILKASKDMPKQCTTFGGSAIAHCAPRKSVGVRMPDDAISSCLLAMLPNPLLCTSAVSDGSSSQWLLDPSELSRKYGSSDGFDGVDFVVDAGPRMAYPSTVVDMTGTTPALLREGKGQVEDWMLMEERDSSDVSATAAALVGGKKNPYASQE